MMWIPGQTQVRAPKKTKRKDVNERWLKMQQLAQTGLYTPRQIAEMAGCSRNAFYKACCGLPYKVERPQKKFDDNEKEPVGDANFLPTDAPVGSAEKVAVMAERVAKGQPLWHPDDRVDFSGLTRIMSISRKNEMIHDSGPGIRVCAVPRVNVK
jgi:hypothetical protein